jgi:hypothetical protein
MNGPSLWMKPIVSANDEADGHYARPAAGVKVNFGNVDGESPLLLAVVYFGFCSADGLAGDRRRLTST